MNEYSSEFHGRFSAALIADAAFRAGAQVKLPPSGLSPLVVSHKIAGPVTTVEANNDLVSIMATVHRARRGEVVVITNRMAEVGLIGDLLVLEAQRKGLDGIIVDGSVRDAAEIVEVGLPVFCRGLLPVGPLKLPAELKGIGESGIELELGDIRIRPGDWAFGDADGVIFISAEDLPKIFEWAEKSWWQEEALAAEIQGGRALGDIMAIDAFLEKRARDPLADFNQHLAEIGRAI